MATLFENGDFYNEGVLRGGGAIQKRTNNRNDFELLPDALGLAAGVAKAVS